jgi:hypothetical protein
MTNNIFYKNKFTAKQVRSGAGEKKLRESNPEFSRPLTK